MFAIDVDLDKGTAQDDLHLLDVDDLPTVETGNGLHLFYQDQTNAQEVALERNMHVNTSYTA